jgi:plasmid replication initiation protein
MSLQHAIELPPGVDLLDRDVALSNALMRSQLRLTLYEKRLVSAALAKLGKRQWPSGFNEHPLSTHAEMWHEWMEVENSPFMVRVTAADYAKAGGVKMSAAYAQLQEAIDGLWERSISMRVRTEKGIEVEEIRWISGRKYHAGEGWAELFWSPQIARHIYNLKNNFTIYKLRKTANLNNDHAIRLFQLFVSWSPDKKVLKGAYRPTIDEFIHSMEVPEAYHNDFAGIRRRVIEKAVAELVKKSGLHIEWSDKRRGKKVISLEFIYSPAEPGDQTVVADDESDIED